MNELYIHNTDKQRRSPLCLFACK